MLVYIGYLGGSRVFFLFCLRESLEDVGNCWKLSCFLNISVTLFQVQRKKQSSRIKNTNAMSINIQTCFLSNIMLLSVSLCSFCSSNNELFVLSWRDYLNLFSFGAVLSLNFVGCL